LSGVAAQKAMEFVAVGREMGAKKVINLDGLFIADQRDHTEASRLASVVFLVLGLFDGSGQERGQGLGLLAVDFAIAA